MAADDREHFPHFGTNAIHTGQEPEQWSMNQTVPPISLSTTFKQLEPGKPKKHDYSRSGNPSREVLEKCLASLEDGKYCRVYSSGLAATMAITNTLKSGDHIVCCDDIYGGTQRFFRKVSVPQHSLEISFVDMTDLKAFNQTLKSNTKMIWLETPSNPLLKVTDIAAIVEITKTFRSDILMVVDNTFMSPYFQRPLSLGADAVMHSVTKYINGHCDVVMGVVMTNDKALDESLKFQQLGTLGVFRLMNLFVQNRRMLNEFEYLTVEVKLTVGAVPSAFDCFLVNRGVKTLHVRMQAHMANAMQIATFLESNPRIEKVIYPELQSHPQHTIHRKQTKGMSGMISFYLRGGLNESKEFLSNLKIFTLAESLGGFDSLAELPAVMTHASVPMEDRLKLGIGDNLIRISVGIEDVTDLIQDLDQALKKAVSNDVLQLQTSKHNR